MEQRPEISFLAWVREDSRSRSLAQACGGEHRTFFDLAIHSRPLVPLRYALSSVRTLAYLVRRRPRSVVVQCPPAPAAALVLGWARVARAPVVLDTHPASFEQGGIHGLMRPLVARLARRAAGCIVTTPRLGEQVRRWGGRPVVVHEAPMPWSDGIEPAERRPDATDHRPDATDRRPEALFVCTFAPDEPVVELLDAAGRLPDVRFSVTGDRRRLTPELRRAAPANVRFAGYLAQPEYLRALTGADVVVSLTCRTDSVQRSAYEAVDALAPLVLSDWPHMHALFEHAVFVRNGGESIAAGVADALARLGPLRRAAPGMRRAQHARFKQQLAQLRAVLAPPARA
ncbi:MAG: glycosyltransferase [Solirubrobacteraceae bacterium]